MHKQKHVSRTARQFEASFNSLYEAQLYYLLDVDQFIDGPGCLYCSWDKQTAEEHNTDCHYKI